MSNLVENFIRRVEKIIPDRATVPAPGTNHVDDTWLNTDIYPGELAIDLSKGNLYSTDGSVILDLNREDLILSGLEVSKSTSGVDKLTVSSGSARINGKTYVFASSGTDLLLPPNVGTYPQLYFIYGIATTGATTGGNYLLGLTANYVTGQITEPGGIFSAVTSTAGNPPVPADSLLLGTVLLAPGATGKDLWPISVAKESGYYPRFSTTPAELLSLRSQEVGTYDIHSLYVPGQLIIENVSQTLYLSTQLFDYTSITNDISAGRMLLIGVTGTTGPTFSYSSASLGSGANVYKTILGTQFQFRSLTGSGPVTVAEGANEITIGLSLSGFVTGITNIGAGSQVYEGMASTIAQLRSLTAGSGNVTVSTVGDNIVIDVPAIGTSAQGINLDGGASASVYAGMSGPNLKFRGINFGAGMTAIQTANDITISTTAKNNQGTNAGGGAGLVYGGMSGDNLVFRSLTGAGGVSISTIGNLITISAAGSGGTGSFSINDITYSTFVAGLTGAGLTAGYYRITDYQTVGYILGSFGADTYTGSVEPLIVFAEGATCYPNALSEVYPHDEIFYDPFSTNWLNDLSFSNDQTNIIPGYKGTIYKRRFVDNDISAPYDWRAVKIRRWKTDTSGITTWAPGNTYTQGQLVLDDNSILYCCLETHTPGSTGHPGFDPNYYDENPGENDQSRRNVRFHWVRLWKSDIYCLNAYLSGSPSLLTTYTINTGTKWSMSGHYVIDVPIGGYEDFLTFANHADPNTNDIAFKYAIQINSDDFDKAVYTIAGFNLSTVPNIRVEASSLYGGNIIRDMKLSGRDFTMYNYGTGSTGNAYLNLRIEWDGFSPEQKTTLFYEDEFQRGEDVNYILDTKVSGSIHLMGGSIETKTTTYLEGYDCFMESPALINLLFSGGSFIRKSHLISSGTAGILNSSLICCDSVQITSGLGDSYFIYVQDTDFLGGANSSRISSGIIDGDPLSFFSAVVYSSYNEIGNGFDNNNLLAIYNNFIGSNFTGNYMTNFFNSNVMSGFQGCTGSTSGDMNQVIFECAGASGIDFSGASLIYQYGWNKTIYTRPDGTMRLRYYNDSDSLVITGPTA